MKFAIIFAAVLGFAIFTSATAGAQLLAPQSHAPQSAAVPNVSNGVNGGSNASTPAFGAGTTSTSTAFSGLFVTSATASAAAPPTVIQTVVQFFQDHSLALAPPSWVAVGGLWIWRGRMRSRWEQMGFDSGVFELFVRMKGGKTRVRLLDSLALPKDRLQLAQELGLDWKAVDRHITMLSRYGFIKEQAAYGRVRMYELTTMGKMLLQLMKDLNAEETEETERIPKLEGP